MSHRVPLSVKRELVEKVDLLSKSEGIGISQACESCGITKDRYYDYRKSLGSSEAASVEAQATGPAESSPAAAKSKGIGDHERVSVPISMDNYLYIEALAKRKAMPLSSLCASLLDEKIVELKKAQI
jgi:hypothetical protein